MSLTDDITNYAIEAADEAMQSKSSLYVKGKQFKNKYIDPPTDYYEKGKSKYEKAKRAYDTATTILEDDTGVEAYKFVAKEVIDKIAEIPIGGIIVKFYEPYFDIFWEALDHLNESDIKVQLLEFETSARNLLEISKRFRRNLEFKRMGQSNFVSRQYGQGAISYSWMLQQRGDSPGVAEKKALQHQRDITYSVAKIDETIEKIREFHDLNEELNDEVKALKPEGSLATLTILIKREHKKYEGLLKRLNFWNSMNSLISLRNQWAGWLSQDKVEKLKIKGAKPKSSYRRSYEPSQKEFVEERVDSQAMDFPSEAQNVDPTVEAQKETLIRAAEEGTPFCEVCNQ